MQRFTRMPCRVRAANVDLDERNQARNQWQRMSEEFNFEKEDRAPDQPFNEVLWAAVKGEKAFVRRRSTQLF